MKSTSNTPSLKAWGQHEKHDWYLNAKIKRCYQQEVLNPINGLASSFSVIQYGALSCDPSRYPLLLLKSTQWNSNKTTVLITGGVHGYETSGIHGALQFAATKAIDYCQHVNLIIAPCVSPWGYETINRWNPNAVDPNRSFYPDSPAEESAALMQFMTTIAEPIVAHIDLHETTDTDELEFRPALAARDGKPYVAGTVPDGFYLVGDSIQPQPEFQRAIIEAVQQVTHIAPADHHGNIIGVKLAQQGVINYDTKGLGLCAGMTQCQYCTTTEVYPDSPLVNDADCNNAQVAAITGALNYLLSIN